MGISKWIDRHHQALVESARDGVAHERSRGNEKGAQAWELVEREAQAKADRRAR